MQYVNVASYRFFIKVVAHYTCNRFVTPSGTRYIFQARAPLPYVVLLIAFQLTSFMSSLARKLVVQQSRNCLLIRGATSVSVVSRINLHKSGIRNNLQFFRPIVTSTVLKMSGVQPQFSDNFLFRQVNFFMSKIPVSRFICNVTHISAFSYMMTIAKAISHRFVQHKKLN